MHAFMDPMSQNTGRPIATLETQVQTSWLGPPQARACFIIGSFQCSVACRLWNVVVVIVVVVVAVEIVFEANVVVAAVVVVDVCAAAVWLSLTTGGKYGDHTKHGVAIVVAAM